MTTWCAPACSQALPVKPQGVWARGIEAWAGSRDIRNLEFRRWGSSGPSSLMSMKFVSSGQIDNKSILVQLMAWCLTASCQYLKSVISEHMLWIGFMIISCEIALMWMQQNTFDDETTLVQVMDWCCQAPSHYMSQCWHSSMPQCGITRPQWLICYSIPDILVILWGTTAYINLPRAKFLPKCFISYLPHLIKCQVKS